MSIINENGKESKSNDLREYTMQLSAKLVMVMCTCIDKIQWYIIEFLSLVTVFAKN